MAWNFGDLLDATATIVPPDRPALIRGERVISWREFDQRTNRLARAMLAAGLETGARVAILARNVPEYVEVAAAAFKARLSSVNLNYRYSTAEIAYVLADCEAAALFYQGEFAATVAPLFATLSHLTLGAAIGAGGAFDRMVGVGDPSPLAIERSGDDGYMLYTGGTTGRPKGVLWRAADARATQLESPTVRSVPQSMADHVALVAANQAPGRVLPACPLMHGAGLNSSLAELLGGGTAALLPTDRFDAEELWDEVARLGITRVLIVGDVFARPMALALARGTEKRDLSSLRVISSSGLTWSREIRQALVAALPGVTLIDILGASEASGLGYAITTASAVPPTGYFQPGPGTAIIDVESGRVLADDEPGEGWLARHGPMAVGYHGDPAKTAATYRTIGGVRYAVPGDVAKRDADGRLHLVGRGSQIINTGGEKVFAEEVEEALKRAPAIEDAMVVGVPDPIWGKAIVALASVSHGYDEAAVRSAMLADLAPYKLPKRIMVLPELPRYASGKGDYRRAAEIAADAGHLEKTG